MSDELTLLSLLSCCVLGTVFCSCVGMFTVSKNRGGGRVRGAPRVRGGAGSSGCQRKGQYSAKDEEILRSAERLVSALMTLVRQKAMSGDRLASRISGWTISVQLFEETGGRLQKTSNTTACLFVNPRTEDNSREYRLQSKVCHEVAHLVGRGHDIEWFDAWTYLLRLSSTGLGWKNEIECGSCIKYNLCNTSSCPRCTWVSGDHSMSCTPINKRGTLRT